MVKSLHGIVHGKSIELSEDLGLADGQQVEVVVKSVGKTEAWGDGLRRCAGSLAGDWTEEDERILEEIHRDRQNDSRRDFAE